MLDNYPPGAANDPNAPYNQVSDIEYTKTVSVVLSFDITVEGPPGADDSILEDWIYDEIKDVAKKRSDIDNFSIDELEIIE